MNLEELLESAKADGCSDIHMTAGEPIMGRRDGRLVVLQRETLDTDSCRQAIGRLLRDDERMVYEEGSDVDCAYQDAAGRRYRVNAYYAQHRPCAAIRLLSDHIPTTEEIDLPAAVCDMADQPRGLVLVTGPTGSGKSTTLAALIQRINQRRDAHIITIEDPIEYVFKPDRCLIHQREVHQDVNDFAGALRSALREDPDVIMVGEMRDLETIAMAITAAETGHLVLSTLHTNSAVATIDRIIDVFPAQRQPQIRSQLSTLLVGVVSQTLVPLAAGSGRRSVMEVMLNNSAIANLIREDKIPQITSTIQINAASGMQLMDQQLARLAKGGSITMDTALATCHSRAAFQQYLLHA